MDRRMFYFPSCWLFWTALGWAAASSREKVLLSEVEVLTLRRGEYTNHRRVSPVKQLSCVHGCSHGVYPDEIQCYNVGYDGSDVNWMCDADLPMGAKLTNLNIQCEGYDHPDDPYILKGSCGATFDITQSRYAYIDEQRGGAYQYQHRDNSGWSWGSLLMLCFIGYIFYNIFCGVTRSTSYTSPSSAPGPSPSWLGGGWGQSRWSPWAGGPGFFSGLGLGSVLGSMWSRPARSSWGWGRQGWGGNHGGNYSFGSAGSSAAYGTPPSSTRRQTAYGTTSRR